MHRRLALNGDSGPEDAEAWWHDFLRVIAAGVVQSLTLGNILCFGAFTKNLQGTLQPKGYDVYLIGESLFIFMLIAGSLLDVIHSILESDRFGNLTRPTRDRFINCTGAILWAAGFGGSVPLTADYAAFSGVVCVLGGLGSGLLFWNVWTMLPSWVPVHSRAFPLAALWLVVSPQAYLFFVTYVVWGLDSIRAQYWGGDSLWGFSYVIISPFGSIALAICACFLATSPSEAHALQPELRDRPQYKTVLPRWVDHPHPIVFGLFLLSCALFQAAYYLPYVFLPTFVTLPPLLGDERASAYALSLLAVGVIVGKVLGAIVLAIATGRGGGSSHLRFSLEALRLWATGFMITACTWLSCVAVPNTHAVAFFLGLFAGGASMSAHVVLYATEPALVLKYTTSALVSAYAFSQALGQTLVTLVVHYGAGGGGYVYATAGFACAFWLAAATLPNLVSTKHGTGGIGGAVPTKGVAGRIAPQ